MKIKPAIVYDIYDTKMIQMDSLLGFASGLGYVLLDLRPKENMAFVSVCPKISKEFDTVSVKTMIELHNNVNSALDKNVKLFYGVDDVLKINRILSSIDEDVLKLAISRKRVETVKMQYSKKKRHFIFNSMIVRYVRKPITISSCTKQILKVFGGELNWSKDSGSSITVKHKNYGLFFNVCYIDGKIMLNISYKNYKQENTFPTEFYFGAMLSTKELKETRKVLLETLQ